MKTEIDIDDYLSEEEKKEIATDAFRNSIFKGLIAREGNRTNYENYERVISNSVNKYLEDEIDKLLDCDTSEMIKSGVIKAIKKENYSYSLFRSKNSWESEDSPAQKVAKDAVESHREEMTKRIHSKLEETIDAMDSSDLYEMYMDAFQYFISTRLTNEKH